MPSKNILLVNEDPSLPPSLQKEIDSRILSTRDPVRLREKFKGQKFPFVIFESKADWPKDLKKFCTNGNGLEDHYFIIAPSGLLKLTSDSIKEISKRVMEKSPPKASTPSTKKNHHKMEMNLALEDFVEGKVKNFVKQMKTCGGRNIYPLLLREIEDPLIRIVLKETNGNQVQAANLLGMNRNTLRKKIKTLNIPIPNNPSRKNGRGPSRKKTRAGTSSPRSF